MLCRQSRSDTDSVVGVWVVNRRYARRKLTVTLTVWLRQLSEHMLGVKHSLVRISRGVCQIKIRSQLFTSFQVL
jgi:hypothetical protein